MARRCLKAKKARGSAISVVTIALGLFIKMTSKKFLLIDGLGAILTCFMHGVVLPRLIDVVGMPKNILLALAFVALIFANYSLSSYFLLPKNWWRNLRNIAYANLLFCVVSIVLVVLNFSSLSNWGLAYFVGEVVLVSLLAAYELKLSAKESASL